MTLQVFLAVLAAAAMHAAWNATIKVRLDRFASISLMTVGMGSSRCRPCRWSRCPARSGGC